MTEVTKLIPFDFKNTIFPILIFVFDVSYLVSKLGSIVQPYY